MSGRGRICERRCGSRMGVSGRVWVGRVWQGLVGDQLLIAEELTDVTPLVPRSLSLSLREVTSRASWESLGVFLWVHGGGSPQGPPWVFPGFSSPSAPPGGGKHPEGILGRIPSTNLKVDRLL